MWDNWTVKSRITGKVDLSEEFIHIRSLIQLLLNALNNLQEYLIFLN